MAFPQSDTLVLVHKDEPQAYRFNPQKKMLQPYAPSLRITQVACTPLQKILLLTSDNLIFVGDRDSDIKTFKQFTLPISSRSGSCMSANRTQVVVCAPPQLVLMNQHTGQIGSNSEVPLFRNKVIQCTTMNETRLYVLAYGPRRGYKMYLLRLDRLDQPVMKVDLKGMGQFPRTMVVSDSEIYMLDLLSRQVGVWSTETHAHLRSWTLDGRYHAQKLVAMCMCWTPTNQLGIVTVNKDMQASFLDVFV
jgi:hypothetical protein